MVTRYFISEVQHPRGLTNPIREEQICELYSPDDVIDYIKSRTSITKEEIKSIREMPTYWDNDEVLDIELSETTDLRISGYIAHDSFKEYETKIGYNTVFGIDNEGYPYSEHDCDIPYDNYTKEDIVKLRDYCNKMLNDWDVLHR